MCQKAIRIWFNPNLLFWKRDHKSAVGEKSNAKLTTFHKKQQCNINNYIFGSNIINVTWLLKQMFSYTCFGIQSLSEKLVIFIGSAAPGIVCLCVYSSMCVRQSTWALQGVIDAAVYTNTNTWAQQDVTEPKHTSPTSWNLPASQLIISNNGQNRKAEDSDRLNAPCNPFQAGKVNVCMLRITACKRRRYYKNILKDEMRRIYLGKQ